jgi:hypothetical protein
MCTPMLNHMQQLMRGTARFLLAYSWLLGAAETCLRVSVMSFSALPFATMYVLSPSCCMPLPIGNLSAGYSRY